MKDTAFYREVKILLNGVRSYGIEHCREKNPNKLLTDSAEWEEFMLQVHKQRFTRGYKRYKETSGLMEWKIGHIFHSIFT